MTKSDKPTPGKQNDATGKVSKTGKVEDAEIVEEAAAPETDPEAGAEAEHKPSSVEATPDAGDAAPKAGEESGGTSAVEATPEADRAAETGTFTAPDSGQEAGRAEPTASVEATPDADEAAQGTEGGKTSSSTSESRGGERSSAVPPVPPTPPVPAPPPRSGGGGTSFMALLLGGFLAGAIGYGLAYFTEFRPFAAEEVEVENPNDALIADLQETVSAQQEQLAQLSGTLETTAGQAAAARELPARIEALEEQVTQITPGEQDIPPVVLEELRSTALDEVQALTARMDTAEAQIAELTQTVNSISTQLTEGSGIDPVAATEALNTYERQLQTLQEQFDAQRTALSEAETRAAAFAQSAEAQQRAVLAEASLARIEAAVLGGDSFDGALSELTSATEAEVPEVLFDVSGTGVSTLAQLRAGFEPAARDAMSAALEAEAGQGTAVDRFGNFLRAQTGARSLEEREGDDADAVLSRARARLAEGDLQATLEELSALPQDAQAAMSGWIAEAETRLAALAAVEELSAAIGGE